MDQRIGLKERLANLGRGVREGASVIFEVQSEKGILPLYIVGLLGAVNAHKYFYEATPNAIFLGDINLAFSFVASCGLIRRVRDRFIERQVKDST